MGFIEISEETISGLITFCGRFGEKFKDDIGKERRNIRIEEMGNGRLLSDMGINPTHGIEGLERERVSEELKEDDTQGVEIGAMIDRDIHTPGLFRRHVGKRTLKGMKFGRARLATIDRLSEAKVNEMNERREGIKEDIVRFNIHVHEVVTMKGRELTKERKSDGEEGV